MTKDEALRQALEALEGNCTNPVSDPEQAAKEDNAITAIKQALEQPEPEPVAWVVYDTENNDIAWTEAGKKLKAETPLYTSPPKREPLTDEWIERFWLDHPTPIKFARAIEAAHGIKGEA